VNRAGYEVRRENRGVPTGHDGDREIEAYDRVNGKHEWRGESSEKQVRGLIPLPVARGATPPHSKHSVNDLLGLSCGAVAQRGEIGDQAHKPEEQGDRAVGRDSKDVP